MTVRAPWRALPPGLTPFAAGALASFLARPGRGRAAVRELADLLIERLGAREVVGTDSGTSALRLAIESAVRPGGTVALPGYGCYDLITAAVGAERRVVLYDVVPSTLAPDMSSLQQALAAGAEAVVVASVFGYAPPMPDIAATVARHGAALVEDVAQGAEARWDGTLLGSWGQFTTLSFGRGKGLGGAGGGALVVRGEPGVRVRELHRGRRAGAIKGASALVAQAILGHPLLFALPSAIPSLRLGETVYHEPWPPAELQPVQAALAVAALSRGDAARQRRARVAANIAEVMTDSPRVQLVRPDRRSQAGFLRVGVFADDETVARLHSLGARRGYPLALARHPVMALLLARAADNPGAESLAASLASLPCHHHVGQDDVRAMARRAGEE